MKAFFIKKLLSLTAILAATFSLNAQDYLSGKLIDLKNGAHKVFYDRTEFAIGGSNYQTIYKVMDAAKKPLFTITLTHDAVKGVLNLVLKEANGVAKGVTLNYDKDSSGLIFSDKGSTDTVFDANGKYRYLLSFADVKRDFPVLHQITTRQGAQLQLDPLTRLRLKKQAGIVKNLRHAPAPIAFVDTFKIQILRMRDSLYTKSYTYDELIAGIRAKIETDTKGYFNEAKVLYNENGYKGERKKGKPHGTGILIEKGNIFDGLFVKGSFSNGNVILKDDLREYHGQFDGGAMNGMGWLKYKNGNFSLGVFINGKFNNGVIFSRETNGEVYFGTYVNDQRNGYGELHNSQGCCYYGAFQDGKLIKGYAREVDQFGYATYSRIEKGVKKMIEQEEASEIFDSNLSVKK